MWKLRRAGGQAKIGGLIGHFNLTNWWLSTFSKEERDYIEVNCKPLGWGGAHPLTQGQVGATSMTADILLNSLASWFRKPRDRDIRRRLLEKLRELGSTGTMARPGYYQGRHFTTYVEEVKDLKQSGDLERAERVLIALVEATEAEDKAKGWGVAPWYYEELAKIYRKRKDYASEVAILERFASQRHAPGTKPPRLLERLHKARVLVKKG